MASTERDRVIYDYHRVLETLADETGVYAYRLSRVMFPLHQVTVRGQGRRAEDYEELEWFVVQAAGRAQVDSIAALRDFYGLDERLVCYVVEALKAIGHLVEKDDGKLVLTSLGRESLADERRYEVYESHQVLYFDAFTCHPLPREYYRLRFLSPGRLGERDRALFSFVAWRPEALDKLARRPDRAEYNVPDEVETLEPLDVGSAYLPMYILEARNSDGEPEWRAFSNIRNRRDLFVESLLADGSIISSLLVDQRPPREAIGQNLEKRGWPRGSYRLDRAPTGEWRVTVPKRWMEGLQSNRKIRLSDVGEHLLAADYCVRLWSDDADIRYQAACIRVLEMLERARRNMPPGDVQHYIQRVFAGLALHAPDIRELIEMAQSRGWEQAMERMEGLT